MDMLNTSLLPFDTKKDLIELSSEWPKWKRAFEFFIEAKGITDQKQKCAFLMHAGGMGLQEIFTNLPDIKKQNTDETDAGGDDGGDVVDDNADDYAKAILKLDNHFCMKRNTTVERYIFRNIRQLSEESIEQFVIRLRTHLSRCDFGSLADEHMRDQIIEGTNSDELRKKALLKNKISLLELLELGQTLEATKINMKNMCRNKPNESETINFVRKNKFSNNGRDSQRKRSSTSYESSNSGGSADKRSRLSTQNNRKCFRCGNGNHLSFDQNCPARKKICERCSRMGHFKKMCRTNLSKPNDSKGPISVRNIEEEEENKNCSSDTNDLPNDGYLFHIGAKNTNNVKFRCIVGNVSLELLIDSGSEVNVLDYNTWKQLKEKKISIINSRKGSQKQLRGYGSKKSLKIVGEFCAKVKTENKETEAIFYVVQEAGQALLGRVTSMELGILQIGDIKHISSSEASRDSTGKIKDVWVDIPIDKSVTPVSQPYRRVPIPLEDKVNKKIEDLLEQVRKYLIHLCLLCVYCVYKYFVYLFLFIYHCIFV